MIVPPNASRSRRITFKFASRRRSVALIPAGPAPTIATSYASPAARRGLLLMTWSAACLPCDTALRMSPIPPSSPRVARVRHPLAESSDVGEGRARAVLFAFSEEAKEPIENSGNDAAERDVAVRRHRESGIRRRIGRAHRGQQRVELGAGGLDR